MSDETMRLIRLSETRDYTLNESMPDVRGWSVEASDGEVVGEVRELIVDRDAGRVRYLEVALSATFAGGEGHRVLVPVGLASTDGDDDVVRVMTVTSGDVRGLEAYDGGGVTRAYEVHLRRSVLGALELPAGVDYDASSDVLASDYAPDDASATDSGSVAAAGGVDDPFYDHDHFDERRMLAGRRVDDDERDFSYLLGVGGAMTESDVNPEIVGELGAGAMRIPVVREETRRSVAPEDA